MKTLINLNYINSDKILLDQKGVFYVVVSTFFDDEKQLCTLKLIEINEYFTNVQMTVPIASNKENEFISVNDTSFVYCFTETELSKKQLSKEINSIIRDKLKQ